MGRKLVASLLLALVPIAVGAHDPVGRCDGGGYPALGIVEVTGGTADSTVYVDDRNLISEGTWTYAETNGVWAPKSYPGVFADDVADHDLQRGGGSIIVPDDGENCRDDPTGIPDMLIW